MRTVLIVTDEKIKLNKTKAEKILIATKVPYLFNDLGSENIIIVSLEEEVGIPSQETWDLLDKINEIIRSCVTKERAWVYEAAYHIEGSGLAQNCADVISSIRVISNILNKYDVDEIIMYPTQQNVIETMVFREAVRKYNIKIHLKFHGIKNLLLTENLNGAVLNLKIGFYIFKAYKDYIKLVKRAHKCNNFDLLEHNVGIIHASEAKKSIGWKETYIYSFNNGVDKCRLMCLNAPGVARYFNERKVASDEMEQWLTVTSVKKRKKEYVAFIKKIMSQAKNKIRYCYAGVDISKTILFFVYMHLIYIIPHNLQVDAICEDYFKKNKYKIVSSQGDSNFIETRAVYFNTRADVTKVFRREGLSLFNIQRYEPYQNIIGIRFFCKDSCRYDELVKQGWKGKTYFIGDTMYISKFIENYKNRTGGEYNFDSTISIIWAPSYVVKGLTTNNTFKANNEILARWFEENRYLLNIKFHPTQDINQIRDLIDKYKDSKYVKIIDQKESFYNWMEKSEIVITDKSLCMFDGITAGKPVMVLCSPLHYELMRQHEEGVRIYQDINELLAEIKRLKSDMEYFKQWRMETIERQDKYFLGFKRSKDGLVEMIEILNKECKI